MSQLTMQTEYAEAQTRSSKITDLRASARKIVSSARGPTQRKNGGREEFALPLNSLAVKEALAFLTAYNNDICGNDGAGDAKEDRLSNILKKPLRFASVLVARGGTPQQAHQTEHADDAADPDASRVILYLTDVLSAQEGALEVEGTPILGPAGTFAVYAGGTRHRGLANTATTDRWALALAFSRTQKTVRTVGVNPDFFAYAQRLAGTADATLSLQRVFVPSGATVRVYDSLDNTGTVLPFTLRAMQLVTANGAVSDAVACTQDSPPSAVATIAADADTAGDGSMVGLTLCVGTSARYIEITHEDTFIAGAVIHVVTPTSEPQPCCTQWSNVAIVAILLILAIMCFSMGSRNKNANTSTSTNTKS